MSVRLTEIEKIYDDGTCAVHNLSLEVREGELFTLLGPSGCGKTTTLRIVAGLEQPTRGSVCIRDRDVTRVAPRDRNVAMVFQSYALYPHMKVYDNLALSLQVARVPKAEVKERVNGVARMLGIEGLLSKKPGQLSGGERQRVALGRAIVRRPNVFLMDEPLSNLDLKLREQTRTELKKLHQQLGVTTLYVTHDQSEALVLSDRIGIMCQGLLHQVGTPRDVYDRPANVFVAKFIGSPTINILRAALQSEDGELRLKVLGSDECIGSLDQGMAASVGQRAKSSPEVLLGIRPEDILVRTSPASGSVEANLELVEPFGSVTFAFLNVPRWTGVLREGGYLVASVDSRVSVSGGQKVWLEFQVSRMKLFDPESEKALGPQQ